MFVKSIVSIIVNRLDNENLNSDHNRINHSRIYDGHNMLDNIK